jgi:hypothetical protein
LARLRREGYDSSMKANGQRQEAPLVPRQYAGQWIAWDHDHTRIIASGETFEEVRQAAIETGEPDPLLDKVPPANVRFVGGNGA